MTKTHKTTFEDFFGALLLIAGLSLLGLFNFKGDEPLVTAGLIAQSDSIVGDTVHGLKVAVEGRDLTLTGLADTPEELSRVQTALRALDGRGRVRTDVTVLEPAEPFGMTVQFSGDGTMQFEGAVPTEAFRAKLEDGFGDGVQTLTLASGMPDEHWPQAAQTALRALQELTTGELRLNARTIHLSGTALTPAVVERAVLLMTDIPEGYVFSSDLEVQDDGTPLRLSAARSDGARTGLTGKLPTELAEALTEGDIEVSTLPLPFEGWEDSIDQGLNALEQLHSGYLTIIGPTLTLTGEAWSQQSYDGALAALTQLPREMSVSHQITLADSGAPFGLTLILTQTGVVATGKVPRSLAPGVLAALLDRPLEASELEIARISPGQDWWDSASQGAKALRFFEAATLSFDGTELLIEGTVQNPETIKGLERHFGDLPAATSLRLNLNLIDDGTPLRMELEYDGTGALLSGKLPDSFRLDQVAAALGAPVLQGELVRTPKPGPEDWPESAMTGAGVLALIERGTLNLIGQDLSLNGVLLNPEREAAVLEALSVLPPTYTINTEFTFQDDGRPFGFSLSFDGRVGQLNGKVPLDLGPASQAAILGHPIEAGVVDFANIPADAEWWIAARSGLKALSDLNEGTLTLDAHQITLSGRAADGTSANAARAQLAPFDGAFKLQVDIVIE